MVAFSVNRRGFLARSISLAVCAGFGRMGRAQEKATPASVDKSKFDAMVARAIEFLSSKGQAADGSFSKQVGIGVTALAATALLRHGRSPDDPVVANALKFILENVQPTGGIHLPNGRLKSYETCV